jgi:hypothetical protein
MLDTVERTLRLAVDAEPEGVRYEDLAGLLGLHDSPDGAVLDLAEMGLITREQAETGEAIRATEAGIRAARTSIDQELGIAHRCAELSDDARNLLRAYQAAHVDMETAYPNIHVDPKPDQIFGRAGLTVRPGHEGSYQRLERVLRDLDAAGFTWSGPSERRLPRDKPVRIGVSLRYAGWLCLQRTAR